MIAHLNTEWSWMGAITSWLAHSWTFPTLGQRSKKSEATTLPAAESWKENRKPLIYQTAPIYISCFLNQLTVDYYFLNKSYLFNSFNLSFLNLETFCCHGGRGAEGRTHQLESRWSGWLRRPIQNQKGNFDKLTTALILFQHTPLRKLMQAYCDRQGLQLNLVRFRFDGNPVKVSAFLFLYLSLTIVIGDGYTRKPRNGGRGHDRRVPKSNWWLLSPQSNRRILPILIERI